MTELWRLILASWQSMASAQVHIDNARDQIRKDEKEKRR